MKLALPILIGKQKASILIEQQRSKGGSSDYNRATPMMRAILSKCVNEDLCRVMPKVTAPVLLFWGDKDTATPISDAHKMERLMPNTGLVVAQGAGHFAMLEQPTLWMDQSALPHGRGNKAGKGIGFLFLQNDGIPFVRLADMNVSARKCIWLRGCLETL